MIKIFTKFLELRNLGTEELRKNVFLLFFSSLVLQFNLFLPETSYARALIADVNPRQIDIDQHFKGAELLIYGAREDAGNIVVVVRGPKERQILRKKGRVFGLWTNTQNIRLKDVYSFYSIASMKPLTSVQNDELLKKLEIGEENIYIFGKDKLGLMDEGEIRNSTIKLMQSKGLYSTEDAQISFWGENLFRTFVKFPKNISKGIYNLDVYLFSDGNLKFYQTMPVIVDKVGIEAFVSEMALKRPLLYGLISVFIALSIGALVGTVFSRR